MKNKIIFSLLVLSFSIAGGVLHADIEMPGRTKSYINDYAGIIDEASRKQLEELEASIKQRTPDKIEVIVATFNDLGGQKLQDFASEYGEKWRLSKKGRDNGVILLVALSEKRVTIGVGQNLKSVLSDKTVNDIIQKYILPDFRLQEYSKGIVSGAGRIVETINNSKIPSMADMAIPVLVSLILVVILATLIKIMSRQRQ